MSKLSRSLRSEVKSQSYVSLLHILSLLISKNVALCAISGRWNSQNHFATLRPEEQKILLKHSTAFAAGIKFPDFPPLTAKKFQSKTRSLTKLSTTKFCRTSWCYLFWKGVYCSSLNAQQYRIKATKDVQTVGHISPDISEVLAQNREKMRPLCFVLHRYHDC